MALSGPPLRWLWLVGALSAVITLFAPPARAQSGAAAAQRHMVEGERAAAKKNWKEALASFRKAHEAQASAATSSRVANALYQLGRTVQAYEAYRALLQDHGKSLFAKSKKTANERLEELGNKTGTLSIRVSEKGAAVVIDKDAKGTSPVPAQIRVETGKRTIKVTKSGFEAFAKTVEVKGGANVEVDVRLTAVATMGRISVKEASGKELRVKIDGVDVGPTPYEADIEPGPHDVAGLSGSLEAPTQQVEVTAGETTVVELVAGALQGGLEVRIKGEEGTIFVDGDEVSKGSYKGEHAAGKHLVVVRREGYETFEKTVTVKAADVHVETVSLRKSAAGDVSTDDEGEWTFDGLYGGLQLAAFFVPTNTANTLEASCDTTGATSCDGGMPVGGGIGGYIGYAFAPVGLELYALGAGDVTEPSASFDGVKGSEINPLAAQPAREEEFIIGRYGGGGAIRLRILVPISRFRITGAIGAGLVYKAMILGRDGTAANGATTSLTHKGEGYFSGAMSVEVAGQVLLGGTTSLAVGMQMWLEHAGTDVQSDPKGDEVFVKEGELPAPHHTPAYDLASGTQFFIGPMLGLHFGP